MLHDLRLCYAYLSYAMLFVLLVVACDRKVRDYPVPPNAVKIDGLLYVRLKNGDGRPAMEGGIWGVEARLLSHKERGCAYPCTRYMLYKRFSWQLEPWNALVRTMREGEIRRVWLRQPNGGRTVFEIELRSVVRTDAHGTPIIEN